MGWLNFRNHRLHSLRYVRDVTIRPELLHAAVQFWDPEVHVFRFGFHELCPTVEEFHAYLGGFNLDIPVVPVYGIGYAEILSRKLGLSNNAARSMMEGGVINIARLISQFRPEGFALCLVILAAFLFVRTDYQANSALVGVAMQIEERKDVAPMVLAETLIGLDRVRAGQTNIFEGSALLLLVGFSLSSPFFWFISRSYFTSTLGFRLSMVADLFSLSCRLGFVTRLICWKQCREIAFTKHRALFKGIFRSFTRTPKVGFRCFPGSLRR